MDDMVIRGDGGAEDVAGREERALLPLLLWPLLTPPKLLLYSRVSPLPLLLRRRLVLLLLGLLVLVLVMVPPPPWRPLLLPLLWSAVAIEIDNGTSAGPLPICP